MDVDKTYFWYPSSRPRWQVEKEVLVSCQLHGATGEDLELFAIPNLVGFLSQNLHSLGKQLKIFLAPATVQLT